MEKKIIFIVILLVTCNPGIPREDAVEDIKLAIQSSSLLIPFPDSFLLIDSVSLDSSTYIEKYIQLFTLDSADTIIYLKVKEDTMRVGDTADVVIKQYLSGKATFYITGTQGRDTSITKETKFTQLQYARFVYQKSEWKMEKISHAEILSDTSSLRITWLKTENTSVYSPSYFISPDSLPLIGDEIMVKTELDTTQGILLLLEGSQGYLFTPEGKEKDQWIISKKIISGYFGVQAIRKKCIIDSEFPLDMNIWFILKR